MRYLERIDILLEFRRFTIPHGPDVSHLSAEIVARTPELAVIMPKYDNSLAIGFEHFVRLDFEALKTGGEAIKNTFAYRRNSSIWFPVGQR